MNSTQIAVLHKGVVAELGNHQQLVNHCGIYAQLVARQMQRDKDKLDEEKDDGAQPKLQRTKSVGSGAGDAAAADDVDTLFNDIAGVDDHD